MIVNESSLAAITRGFRAIFNDTLQKTPDRIDDIATRIPSTTTSQDFPLAALTGTLREWLGDRVIQNLAAWTHNVVNKDFEQTVGIKRKVIEDDQIGLYNAQFQTLAQQAKLHPFKEAIRVMMTAGFSGGTGAYELWDDANFFSAAHYWPGAYETAQDNLTDELLDAAAVIAGRVAMMGFRGPDGEPLDVVPTHFLCAPANWSTAKNMFCLPTATDSAAANPLYGMIKEENIIVDARISAAKWALLDCSKPVKPIVNQRRKEPELVAQTAPDSDGAFLKGEYRYGVDYRGAVVALGWWMAYGSSGDGS